MLLEGAEPLGTPFWGISCLNPKPKTFPSALAVRGHVLAWWDRLVGLGQLLQGMVKRQHTPGWWERGVGRGGLESVSRGRGDSRSRYG